jgi:topoisomerase-4 subunit A
LQLDIPNDAEVISMRVLRPDGKLLIANTMGMGFVVAESTVEAQTRSGKQILNLADDEAAAFCRAITDETMVATIGANRRLLVFTLAEIPEMTRSKGVILQRFKNDGLFKDGGLSDICLFKAETGFQWAIKDGVRTCAEYENWHGKRAQVGKTPPTGFPRSNKFGL